MRLLMTILICAIAALAFIGAIVWAGLSRLEQIYRSKHERHLS